MLFLIIIQESKLINTDWHWHNWHRLNVIILIKSVFNENQNHYDFNGFLGKGLSRLVER